MNVRIRACVAAAFLTLLAACAGGGVPVQSPTTLAANGNLQLTEQVILDVLPKRGWTAESVQPGRVLAFLAVRSHLLRVELRYDARQIGIYYVDSDNLKAQVGSDGQVYAHKQVNRWIRQLALDLASGLSESGTPAPGSVASPASVPGAAGAAPPTSPPAGAPATGIPPAQ